uniref:Uncharacterized protein n=1 Tax=Zea mays TaxID=4577 RepID=A0A804P499_MAIZE
MQASIANSSRTRSRFNKDVRTCTKLERAVCVCVRHFLDHGEGAGAGGGEVHDGGAAAAGGVGHAAEEGAEEPEHHRRGRQGDAGAVRVTVGPRPRAGGGEVHDGGGAAAGGVGHATKEGAEEPGHHRRGRQGAAAGVRVAIGPRPRDGVVVAPEDTDATAAAAGARRWVRDEGPQQELLGLPRLPAGQRLGGWTHARPPASRACAGASQGRSLLKREERKSSLAAVSLFGRNIFVPLPHVRSCMILPPFFYLPHFSKK